MGNKRTQRPAPKRLPTLDIVLNDEQQEGYEIINTSTITYINGRAGSGKTLLALYAALDALHGNEINKIFITRPHVTAHEDLGFLPGDISEKMNPFMLPIYDNLTKLYPERHKSSGVSKVEQYINDREIEIAPIAYMRGITFDTSYVILDEAQNISAEQLIMAVTRLGKGSKMIICGDLRQCDLKKSASSGLFLLQEVLNRGRIKGLSHVYLKENHRDHIVQELLDEFEELGYFG